MTPVHCTVAPSHLSKQHKSSRLGGKTPNGVQFVRKTSALGPMGIGGSGKDCVDIIFTWNVWGTRSATAATWCCLCLPRPSSACLPLGAIACPPSRSSRCRYTNSKSVEIYETIMCFTTELRNVRKTNHPLGAVRAW